VGPFISSVLLFLLWGGRESEWEKKKGASTGDAKQA
jgi:hypothetical protein